VTHVRRFQLFAWIRQRQDNARPQTQLKISTPENRLARTPSLLTNCQDNEKYYTQILPRCRTARLIEGNGSDNAAEEGGCWSDITVRLV
jgi:hypothetical protein